MPTTNENKLEKAIQGSLQKIMNPSGVFRWLNILAVLFLLALSAFFVINFESYWSLSSQSVYVPILVASILFRIPGAILTGLLGGLIVTSGAQFLGFSSGPVFSLSSVPTIAALTCNGILVALLSKFAFQHRIHGEEKRKQYSDNALKSDLELFATLRTKIRIQEPFTVVNATIGNYEEILVLLGIQTGSALLQRVGSLLYDSFSKIHDFYHVGENQICFVLNQDDEMGVFLDILSELKTRTIEVKDVRVFPDLYFGLAVFEGEEIDPFILVKKAYMASLASKRDKLICSFYEDILDSVGQENTEMLTRFAGAIERGELTLFYQPRIDLPTGTIVGVEALVRWKDPDIGFIPPAKFVPVVEKTGLISVLTKWVIQTAFAQQRRWEKEGIHLQISINISAMDLNKSLLEFVQKEILGVNPDRIEFELTETSLSEDLEKALQVMHDIVHTGIRFSIDDFGTGFSSLSYLKKLPIDTIKIDQEFIRDLSESVHNQSIAASSIQIAGTFGYQVVAEGIETKESLDILKRMGCPYGQGYFFSKPVPVNELESLYRAKLLNPVWGQK